LRISDNATVERILKAVADPENMQLMMSIRKESKPAQVLSAETGIPLSTVYRKLDDLKEAGLVMTEHFIVQSGKKVDFIITTFSEIKTVIEADKVAVEMVPSTTSANVRWLSLFRGD